MNRDNGDDGMTTNISGWGTAEDLLQAIAVIATDPMAAETVLRRYAEQGDPVAQFHLAAGYLFKSWGENDPEAAFNWNRQAAENGHLGACSALASHYEQGLGVAQDMGRAVLWYGRVAHWPYLDNGAGAWHLGTIFEAGWEGEAPNIVGAAKYYRIAADFGLADAMFDLGRVTLTRHPGRRLEGFAWCDAAVSAGSERALQWLDGELEHWFEDLRDASAAANNADSRYRLASLYMRRRRDEGDLKRAVGLFEEAAEQGHPGAATYLGAMYANGISVKCNAERAERLFAAAIAG